MEEKQLLATAALVCAVVCSEKPNKKKRKRHRIRCLSLVLLRPSTCLLLTVCFPVSDFVSAHLLVVYCVTSLRPAIILNTFDIIPNPRLGKDLYETRSQTADYHLKLNDRDDGSAPRLQLDS